MIRRARYLVIYKVKVDLLRFAVAARFHFQPDLDEFVVAKYRYSRSQHLSLKFQQFADIVLLHTFKSLCRFLNITIARPSSTSARARGEKSTYMDFVPAYPL